MDRDTKPPSDQTRPIEATVTTGQHHSGDAADSLQPKPGEPHANSLEIGHRVTRQTEALKRGADTTLDHLRKKLLSAHDDYESLAQEVDEAYTECERLEDELNVANRDNCLLQDRLDELKMNSDKQISELQAQTFALQRALHDTQREKEKLQNDVRVAQEGALQSMEKENHTFMEDREVREQLSKVGDKFIAWAKKHAIDDMSTLKSVPEKELSSIIEWLEGYCIQETWSELQSTLLLFVRKLPLLLVQASISKHVFRPMLSNLFFFPFWPRLHTPSERITDGKGIWYDQEGYVDSPNCCEIL
jgi:hypothetical protein